MSRDKFTRFSIHRFYPSLQPAYERLVGTSDPAVVGHLLRLSFCVISLLFIFAAYRFGERYLGPHFAFLATLVTVLHVHTIWMSELFFAELPFALLSILFLLVVQDGRRGLRAWLAGGLAVACFLLRSSGIALMGAWVGESLFNRQFKQMAVRACVALIPVLAWQAYISNVKNGTEFTRPAYDYQRAGYQFYNVGYMDNLAYVDPFAPEQGLASPSLWLKRIVSNLMSMPESLGSAISVKRDWVRTWIAKLNGHFGTMWAPSDFVVGIPFVPLGGLVLAGLILLMARREWLVALYLVGSLALICLTPWPGQFDRYLWPLTPVLTVASFSVLLTFLKREATSSKMRRIVSLALATTVVVGTFSTESLALFSTFRQRQKTFYKSKGGQPREYSLFFYTDDWREHDSTLVWLEQHAAHGEIVATAAPHWVYLKTGLPAVMPPFETDPQQAQRLLDSVPVTYLILDNFRFIDVSTRYAAPVVSTLPARWELVYLSGSNESRIYRRKPQVQDPVTASKVSPSTSKVGLNTDSYIAQ